MSLEIARSAFLWCTVINYAVLLLWFLLYAAPHGLLFRLLGRWVRSTPEQFDTLNIAGMMLYKLGIMLFNLAPFVALCIVG
jgi:hypothetical protein